VEKEVGAKRIFGHLQQKNDRNEDVNLKSWEDVLASNEKRLESDRLRYQKYYQIDVNDLKHYDFYLDTTKFNQDEVFAQVWEAVKEKLGLK
jgi:cytidylate kinase